MNIFSFYFGFLLRIVLAVAVPFSSTENDNEFKIDLSHLGVQIFGMPDNETGKLVANYDPREDKFNPEELGSYLEGDMLVPGTMSRNGLTLEITRWPDGIVPFEIDGDFGKTSISSHLGDKSFLKWCFVMIFRRFRYTIHPRRN